MPPFSQKRGAFPACRRVPRRFSRPLLLGSIRTRRLKHPRSANRSGDLAAKWPAEERATRATVVKRSAGVRAPPFRLRAGGADPRARGPAAPGERRQPAGRRRPAAGARACPSEIRAVPAVPAERGDGACDRGSAARRSGPSTGPDGRLLRPFGPGWRAARPLRRTRDRAQPGEGSTLRDFSDVFFNIRLLSLFYAAGASTPWPLPMSAGRPGWPRPDLPGFAAGRCSGIEGPSGRTQAGAGTRASCLLLPAIRPQSASGRLGCSRCCAISSRRADRTCRMFVGRCWSFGTRRNRPALRHRLLPRWAWMPSPAPGVLGRPVQASGSGSVPSDYFRAF